MNSLNDGNLNVGFGDDVLILELNEYVSPSGKDYSFPGGVSTVKDTKGEVIGQVFSNDPQGINLTFKGVIGSTILAKLRTGKYKQLSFVEDGEGYAIYNVDASLSETETPSFTGSVVKMVNGLITSPARDTLNLTVGSPMTPLALSVIGIESGGTYTVDGVAGLDVNESDEIEGTPTEAGTLQLDVYYDVEVTENGVTRTKSTKRSIDVLVSAS